MEGSMKPLIVRLGFVGFTVGFLFSTEIIFAQSFSAKTDFTTNTHSCTTAVGDHNGDGDLNLAVANAVSSAVPALSNTVILSRIETQSNAIKLIEFTSLFHYLNPYNSNSIIKFSLLNAATHHYAFFHVYDLIRRVVTTLVNENKQTGGHSII
jgi:hypothetical protein